MYRNSWTFQMICQEVVDRLFYYHEIDHRPPIGQSIQKLFKPNTESLNNKDVCPLSATNYLYWTYNHEENSYSSHWELYNVMQKGNFVSHSQ